MITVRTIQPDDLPEILGWAERRGTGIVPRLMSPHGFVAVDGEGKMLITAWAALIMDCPIVQVDHVYMTRRFKADDLREGWVSIVDTIRQWVKLINERHGYGYSLIEIVMNPVMEKEAERAGGVVSQRTFKKCHYLI